MSDLDALTVADVARLRKVDPRTVLGWIHSGQLVASDESERGEAGAKPRYRIDPAELRAFVERRKRRPTPKADRRKRRREAVTEYV